MGKNEGEKLHAQICELLGKEKGEAAIVASAQVLHTADVAILTLLSDTLRGYKAKLESIAEKDEPNSRKAIDHLSMRLSAELCCTLLTAAADVSVWINQHISEFVGHSAEHFERAKRDFVLHKMSSLFDDMQASAEEELTKKAAEMHSPGN